MSDIIIPKGYIEAKIKHKDTGLIENLRFDNQVLNAGKELLINALLEPSKARIVNILFGDGGTENGEPKEVSPTQDKLNGVVRMRKSVIAQIDPETPTQAIFTVVINEDEGNDFVLNEMGLELSDENLFSLSTFSNLNKTDQMEISWSWFVCLI